MTRRAPTPHPMNRARRPLARLAPGLPAAWYRDPGHHDRELEAIWYRGWIAACREEEIARAGDWKLVRVGTQAIVVTRGEDGRVRAFHNTCRHRGSVLCTAEAGRFERGRIVCPYHAWTYALDGRLVATPRRMPVRGFDAGRLSLLEVSSAAWGGFVFLDLAGRPGSFKAFLADAPAKLANYRLQDLRVGKRIVADVKANWKLIAENFAECYHCPPVHPELCRVVTAYREAGAWGLRGKEATGQYKPGARTLTLDGTARLPALPGLSRQERQTLYLPWMLPPNLYLNVHPDYVNAHLVFPTGPASVRIVYDWLFDPAHMPRGADLAHYTALWERTNAQDARNCEWQQEGLASRAFRHGWYAPQEFDSHRFAQWVRRRLRSRRG